MSQRLSFVLIVTEVGREYEVLRELLQMEGVSKASVVYGEFDVICIIKSDSLKSINATVMKIRKIKAIIRTTTLISH